MGISEEEQSRQQEQLAQMSEGEKAQVELWTPFFDFHI